MHVILIYNPFTQKPSNLVLSILWFIGSDYSFVIFKPCIVYPLIYRFWLLLCYLQTLYCLSFDLQVLITLCYLQTVYCLSFDLQVLITPLLSSNLVLSILWFTGSDYSFVFFKPCIVYPLIYRFWLLFVIFKPCIVYPLIYRFWLLLCYLQTFLIHFCYNKL
jgi:hypothetical protein